MTYYSLKWATANCIDPASWLDWTRFVGLGPAACMCGRLPQPRVASLLRAANCPSIPACFSATQKLTVLQDGRCTLLVDEILLRCC